MSFVSNALGVSNGYQATSGGGAFAPQQQQKDLDYFNAVYGQQGDLAKQLLSQSQGQGPNIANLQLQQATNQNNQQAAGAIASQKGMNPALAQRLIAQQQSTNNQNAAGQSGVLRAQQQLSAQNNLANVYGQQAGEALGNYGTLTEAQSGANKSNAQIAQNNANQNAGIASGIIGGAAHMIGMSEGGNVDSPEAHLERLLISIGSKVKPMHLAAGGSAAIDPDLVTVTPDLFGGIKPPKPPVDPMAGATSLDSPATGGLAEISSAAPMLLAAAHGAKVPAMVSPGELYIPPQKVAEVAAGKKSAHKAGHKVPGKAKVSGDSEKNDTVPAALDSGGVVVPRSKSKNDVDAREFILALQKEKADKEGPSSFAKVLEARRKRA